MNAFKFRAWDKTQSKMITPEFPFDGAGSGAKEYAVLFYGSLVLFSVHGFEPSSVCDFSVMPSTGLPDKNGKEIFRGDIVKGDLIYPNTEGRLPTMGVVEYCDGYAAYCLENEAGQTLFHKHIISSFEVVGNIYENPELVNWRTSSTVK